MVCLPADLGAEIELLSEPITADELPGDKPTLLTGFDRKIGRKDM